MPGRKRRGHGEGSIFRRKDGRWVVELFLGYGPDGKRVIAREYARSRSEAQGILLKMLKDREEGLLVTSREKPTVQDFLKQWLEDVLPGTVRPKTLENYRYVVRHIVNEIGEVELRKLTPLHLHRLYRKKQEQGLTRMVVLMHAVLHKALGQAVKWGLVTRNVADAVDRPKVTKKEFRPLSAEELARFLEASRSDRLHAMYVLAATCGMRMGELLGLKWDDVDFGRRTLTVQRQLQWLRGEPTFTTPKSEKSRRTIPLPEVAYAALQDHRAKQGEERRQAGDAWKEHGLVFTTTIGTPLSPANVRHRSFYPLLQKAGLPRIRFHDLRHTTATALLEQGVHPRLVQELLGHSQISVTLGTYSHVMAPMLRQAAAAMDAFLARSPSGAGGARVSAES